MDGVKYKNFQFKANNKNYYTTLKLLAYESNYSKNIDYAIFYDPLIVRTGLYPANPDEDQAPQYVLGNTENNLNLVKRYSDAKEGESGSPILNSNCHVIGRISHGLYHRAVISHMEIIPYPRTAAVKTLNIMGKS